MNTKILLIALFCLTHQAFSGMILTDVTFVDPPTTDPILSDPTTTQTTTDPSVTTDPSTSQPAPTGNIQTTEAPVETQTSNSGSTTTTSNEEPIVITPQQPQIVEEPIVVTEPESSEENLSVDSQSTDKPSEKSRPRKGPSKIAKKIRRSNHDHHLSCKRANENKILDLLAQERIHLIDFPQFNNMKSADRVINLQAAGKYELTFTALTFAPQNGLTSAKPILEVIINGEVHHVELGFNETELSFIFTGKTGVNNVKLTLKGDSNNQVPAQANLSDFKVTLQ